MFRVTNAVIFVGMLLLSNACTDENNDPEQANLPQIFRISDGIEVSLVAPQGFQLSKEHYGFVQIESFSRIRITEKELPFTSYIDQLTKENLLRSRLQLVNREDIGIRGAVCSLLTLRENIAGTYFEKLWLISGDKLSSVQIEASYPEGASQKHKQAIRESLLSIEIATHDEMRLFTGLPFMLTDMPGFTLKKRYSNSVLLLPVNYTGLDKSLVISHGATKNAVETIQQLSDYFLNKGERFKNVEIVDNEMIKLNAIPALKTVANVEHEEKPTWFYQVVSYQKQRFLLVQAHAPLEDSTDFAASVDELLKHFEFK